MSQSGWLFADLLIALSVIFLATISFIPSTQGGQNTPSLEPGKLARSDGFAKIYESVSAFELVNDLNIFKRENSLASRTDVIHLQFIGSSKDSINRTGVLDALEFSITVRNLENPSLSGVSTSLSTSNQLEPGQVLVRAVFGSKALTTN